MYASEKQLRNEAKHLKELIDSLAQSKGEEIDYLYSLISEQTSIINSLQEQITYIKNVIENE